MANTYSLMQVWDTKYEYTHYKQPVFRAFADEKYSPGVREGATFNREYASDLVVNKMGAAGTYAVQSFTNTLDTGTVNIKEETSIQIVEWQKLQDHLPTQLKYTTKAANALWLQVDANILGNMAVNAASVIDDSVINPGVGTAGNAFTVGIQNIMSVFSAGIQQFQLLNVVYDPNKTLPKDVKLETISDMLAAAISPQLYNFLVQYLGGKTTMLGDKISRNGHVGEFMGYNLFVTNQLMWEGQLSVATQPGNGDTFTLLSGVTVKGVSQALVFTFVTGSLGTTPGNILNSSNSTAATNAVAGLNAPYTLSANYFNYTQSALTVWQQKLLYNVTASVVSTTTIDIQVNGAGVVPVAATMTTSTNGWIAKQQKQHNLFATSKSVSLLMQAKPHLFLNPVSGAVARDLVTWDLYGVKVFYDQSFQIIDVQVDCSSFGASGTPVNQFN